MGKTATTIAQQMAKLEHRGMKITDREKCDEILRDIGYFRLGFYWFPYEINYPNKRRRNHAFKQGTEFNDAVGLYYFDFDLRHVLTKYLTRIEVNFRNKVIYHGSIKNRSNPTWFADTSVVDPSFTGYFTTRIYTNTFKKNTTIADHIAKHPGDAYPPAWKTLEYLAFGHIINLYNAILDPAVKNDIMSEYGVSDQQTFDQYMTILLAMRNACAHGKPMFDFLIINAPKKGPATTHTGAGGHDLKTALEITRYFLGKISTNRAHDFERELMRVFYRAKRRAAVHEVLNQTTGLKLFRHKFGFINRLHYICNVIKCRFKRLHSKR